MRCRDVERLLPQYADDALTAAQTEGLEAHLAGCAHCRYELAQLRRSLEALRRVAHTPAPDLWAQFQARLAQSEFVPECADIEALLPGYALGELEDSQYLQIREHLPRCSRCAAEAAEFSASLRALKGIAQAPSVDLWPAFCRRLGSRLTCGEVEELLPALLAGDRSLETVPAELHLQSCHSCAATVAGYERPLAALGRVAHATPEVDLWPVFAERLREEQRAQPRRRPAFSWLPALGAWLRGPLLQPALGLAAFTAITVAGHFLARTVSYHLRGTNLTSVAGTRSEEPTTRQQRQLVSTAGRGRQKPSPKQPVRMARSESLERLSVSQPDATDGHARHREHLPPTGVSEPRFAPRPSKTNRERASTIQVAFNLPPAGAEGLPGQAKQSVVDLAVSTAINERDGTEAVVQVVELLAENEDALNSPFASNPNDE